MTVEFHAVEYREEPDRNWRRAYHEQIGNIRYDLLRARESGDGKPRFWGYKRYVPRDMTDAQIDWLARRMAEAYTERAINEQRAKLAMSRKRQGRAI